MRKEIFNKTKRIFALSIAGILMLSGCGNNSGAAGDNSEAGSQSSGADDEYVYAIDREASDSLELPDTESLWSAELGEDILTYCDYNYKYDDETGDAENAFVKYSIKDKTELLRINPEDNLDISEFGLTKTDTNHVNVGFNSYAEAPDGKIYILAYIYSFSDEDEYGESYDCMMIYDAEGNFLSYKNMAEYTKDNGEQLYFSGMKFDSEGNLLLCANEKILIFDSELNKTGVLEAGNYIDCIFKNNAGDVYGSYYNAEYEHVLAKIDSKACKFMEELKGFPLNINGFSNVKNDTENIIVYNSSSVYKYNFATQTAEVLLNWVDCDISGDYVRGINILDDGVIYVMTNDYSTGNSEILVLRKFLKSELPDTKEVVLALFADDYMMNNKVVAFNKSQSEYHVTIKKYYDYDSNTDYEAAVTDFQNAIVSDNAPDITYLGYLDVPSLVSKGVLMDLNGFIENSTSIDKNDYVESVIDAYTYDGKLISIPTSFTIQTLAGKASELGNEKGWSIGELIEYDKSHPDSSLMRYSYREEIIHMLLTYNLDYFADFSTGECRFDTQEFKDILEYAATWPEDFDWDNADNDTSDASLIADGKILLNYVYLGDVNELQCYNAMFADDVNYIGFPTVDGTPAAIISAEDAYGIVAQGKCNEGAWAFLEFCLSNPDSNDGYYGIPSNKKRLQEIFDENLKHAGEPNGSGMSYGDGWSYDYHYTTQEEIDALMEIIDTAKAENTGNEEIIKIINEEADAFFSGQKSVNDVASVIQNRVSIYVSENR